MSDTDKLHDVFGEILIKSVRDEAIEQWEKTIQGELKSRKPKIT
jgi:hypothetical protein